MSNILRLGIIGLSDGNGHPYSWSAILNGYNAECMEECGFPVIPRYLEQQNWPQAKITTARVTHVWTQDVHISRHIAKTTFIENVVERPEDMQGRVDGVLLARDDAASHYEFAAPFLAAGLPVYIDKPICLTEYELNQLYALQRYPGQIFTCSALRYAPELQISCKEREQLGQIREIHAMTPKFWNTYAVHAIEPMLALVGVGEIGELTEARCISHPGGGATVHAVWESGFRATVTSVGEGKTSPISLRVIGSLGCKDLHFVDSFTAFRAALHDFVEGIVARDVRTDPNLLSKVVQLLEVGKQAWP